MDTLEHTEAWVRAWEATSLPECSEERFTPGIERSSSNGWDWKEPKKPLSKPTPWKTTKLEPNEENSELGFSKCNEQEESSGAIIRS